MKKEEYKIIFDMDGTLYPFDKGKTKNFFTSRFYSDLKNNIYGFFMAKLGLDMDQAINEYERIKEKYQSGVSLGVETEYNIDRYNFFTETWGTLDPINYIETNKELSKVLNKLSGKIALLTSAPRVWVDKVLNYLNLEKAFGNTIYTGEPNLRKPNPLIFRQIADDFKINPCQVFSIGDQEESDVIPAQSIGMKAVLIGQGKTKADYQADDIIVAINILKKKGFL
jgi:HAD superfamily hydrolase (TIGR01549 family)